METSRDQENFQTMRERILKAETPMDIDRIERAMVRLWNVGAFTTLEANRLHVLTMERACAVERGTE